VDYEGRARLDSKDQGLEVAVRIPDVESPDWFARVIDCVDLRNGEVAVTLVDGGFYNAWRGAALARVGRGGTTLLGLEPLTPPVGAGEDASWSQPGTVARVPLVGEEGSA
jgi:hypothetical protein